MGNASGRMASSSQVGFSPFARATLDCECLCVSVRVCTHWSLPRLPRHALLPETCAATGPEAPPRSRSLRVPFVSLHPPPNGDVLVLSSEEETATGPNLSFVMSSSLRFVKRSAAVVRPALRQPAAKSTVLQPRLFSTGRLVRADEDITSPGPLLILTEEEEMMRESVARFAKDVVEPKVREMDENEKMDPAIIKGLYGMHILDTLHHDTTDQKQT